MLQTGRTFVAFNPAISWLPPQSSAKVDGADDEPAVNDDRAILGRTMRQKGHLGVQDAHGRCSPDGTALVRAAGQRAAGQMDTSDIVRDVSVALDTEVSDGVEVAEDEGEQYIVFFRYSDVRSIWSMGAPKPWQRDRAWRVRKHNVPS